MRSVRQHVNPLGLHYLKPRAVRLARPSHLDEQAVVEVELGCADGDFSFALAAQHPDRWVVGLEIREALVDLGRERARRRGLPNLDFGYVNMNVDLDRVFGAGGVDRFHVLFPDPWFKKRHRKRRVVEPGLLTTMATQLKPGGELHLATDIFEVALAAMDELEAPGAERLGFENLHAPWTFSREPPTEAMSRRERTTHRRGERVWRLRYSLGTGASG